MGIFYWLIAKQGGTARNPRPCQSLKMVDWGEGFLLEKNMNNEQPMPNPLLFEALNHACTRLGNIVVSKEIPSIIDGGNIFMGIGFLFRGQVSVGLGLPFINMACLASQIRQETQDRGLDSHIFILEADSHALAQITDPKQQKQVAKVSQRAQGVISNLFTFLGCPTEDFTILSASSSDWPKSNEPESYAAQETTDIVFSHEKLDCGVKVGWQTKRQPLGGACIRDESWFDQQARGTAQQQLVDMAFVRTLEGFSVTGSWVPPYFADSRKFSLGQPLNLVGLAENGQISPTLGKDITQWNSQIKYMRGIRQPTEPWEVLQQLIDACCI